MKTIQVNGRDEAVKNTLSCGPGCEPHTYVLANGNTVEYLDGAWWLRRGSHRFGTVTVKGGGS